MRIRTVKPEFWESEDIAAHDWDTRLVFIGLWSYVDDNGVGRDVPKLIVADLFPLDEDPRETLSRVTKALDALAQRGQIVRYEADGRPYLHIVNWKKHQRIDHPNKPRYPEPTCADTDPAGSVAQLSRDPRESVAPGTEEQRNRGTEEQDLPGRSATVHDRTSEDDTLIPAKAIPAPTFDDFWAAYPRHENRARAKDAWTRLVRKIDPAVIVAGARRLAEDPNLPEKRLIPHPTSWLNGRRWEDDPLPPLLDRKRDQRDSPLSADGSINADAVLGKDTWSIPSSPPGIEPGTRAYTDWAREVSRQHHAERAELARETLARRSA